MKQLIDISGNFSFYLVLGFLFLINFSIAGCYILFTLLLIQFIIFSIEYLKHKKDKSKPPRPFPQLPGFYKYLLLYILFTFISTIFSIEKLNSLKDNKEFFVFLLIPIFLLILNSRKRLDYSLYTVLASAVISSLIGIAITLKRGTSLDHRLHGLTSHWMTYSGLLMFVFIFFFVYLFYEKKIKTKIFLSVFLLIILSSILLSLTRSMWVGIFVSLGIFIIYYKPKILYLAVPVVIILVLLLPGSIKTRLVSIFDLNNTTNKDRIYMISTGINIFKERPLTGVGPNNINQVYDRYKPAGAEQSNPHLHNNLLHVLAERGIFAFLCLVLAFVSITIQLIKKIKNSINFEKTAALGALFVFIGFFIAGMFEYNLGDSEIKFLLFYFLSVPFIQTTFVPSVSSVAKNPSG